jgi:hypothetical protein
MNVRHLPRNVGCGGGGVGAAICALPLGAEEDRVRHQAGKDRRSMIDGGLGLLD